MCDSIIAPAPCQAGAFGLDERLIAVRWLRGTVVRVALPNEPGLIHTDGRMVSYVLDSRCANNDPLRQDMAVEFTVLADGSAVGVHSLAADSPMGLAIAASSAATAIDRGQGVHDSGEDAAPGSARRSMPRP